MVVGAQDAARRRPVSLVGVAAAVVALGTDVMYVSIIRAQGTPPLTDGRFLFIATMIGVAGCAALAAAPALSGALRLALIGFSTGTLISLGIAGIFSIGIFLLTAGTLAAIAWRRTRRTTVFRGATIVGWGPAAAGVASVFAGLFLT
jgi:hypothetical protein